MFKIFRFFAVFYIVAAAFFSWGWLAVKFEVFPFKHIEPHYAEITAFFSESHQVGVPEIIKYDHQERKSQFDFSGFKKTAVNFHDNGYLLLSRYSKEHQLVVIDLYSIGEGKTLHTWVPDLEAVFRMTPNYTTGINTHAAYRSQHPLLMNNGDIVMTSGEGPLVRIDSCGNPKWVVSRHFHHSIEKADDGSLIVPIVISEAVNDLGVPMREDGFAVVSPNGQLIKEYSIYDILIDNDYRALIYGVGTFETDSFHLNDVQPIEGQPDKVLLSIRNLSSIALFNMNTGEIEWLKTGPWVSQHDVNYLADGRISIFGNDYSRSTGKLMNDGFSQVYIYDPNNDMVETPYTDILKNLGMRTEYEGRVKLLANGDAFIEETNRDRLLRISRENVRWQYVNGISDNTTGAIHWSRYLKNDAVSPQLLDRLTCRKR